MRFSCLLAATAAIAAALTAGATAAAPLTPFQAEAHDIFRELIELKTTSEFGASAAAGALARHFNAAGFAGADLQEVGPTPQNHNLVVRLRGRGTAKPVLFIGHLDVVEARREDWSVDPFVFLEKDGWYYGRGTTDMKGDCAAMAASLLELKRSGYIPDRDIIVAFTDHEEVGEPNGIRWLLAHRRDLIDAEFCINPDGGGGEINHGRHTLMSFETAEKTYLTYQLEVTNPGGHSSLPRKDNAIYTLAAGLCRLAAYQFPIEINDTTREYFRRAAAQESGARRADMLAVAAPQSDLAAAERLAAASPYYNAILRTTCVATMLAGGHEENALPQMARATLNARMMPGDDPALVTAQIEKIVADPQIKVTETEPDTSTGPVSPLRADVMRAIDQITHELWPEVAVTPVLATGASDGKFLRQAGMPVYTITGQFGDVDDVRAHGGDERIGVKEFFDDLTFTHALMKRLSGPGTADSGHMVAKRGAAP